MNSCRSGVRQTFGLVVEAQEVVQREAESGDGSEEIEGVVRAVPVVIVEEGREAQRALVGMGVGVSVSPLAEGGLDEALGLAVSLRAIGAGETLLEAEGGDGGAHGTGAVAGAVVGIDALGVDAVLGKESERGVEERAGAGRGFILEKLSEGEA